MAGPGDNSRGKPKAAGDGEAKQRRHVSGTVVANDGSKDRTGEVLRELAQRYPQLKPVEHPINQGYGAAVFTALSNAVKDVIFFTDSDRQFKLEEIDLLTPHLNEADLVVGYRAPRRDPPMRVLFGHGWSSLVTLLFGYTARDIDCAFKLVRRQAFTNVAPFILSRGATFSAEWLVLSKRAGYGIVEVPVSHLPRRAGAQTFSRRSRTFSGVLAIASSSR